MPAKVQLFFSKIRNFANFALNEQKACTFAGFLLFYDKSYSKTVFLQESGQPSKAGHHATAPPIQPTPLPPYTPLASCR
jgi:hypothetical protein